MQSNENNENKVQRNHWAKDLPKIPSPSVLDSSHPSHRGPSHTNRPGHPGVPPQVLQPWSGERVIANGNVVQVESAAPAATETRFGRSRASCKVRTPKFKT